MMFWYGHHLTGWAWFGMVAVMALPWLLVVALVVWLVLTVNRRDRRTGAASPERMLAERFAGGEIDQREYEQRLAVIRAAARPGPDLIKNSS